MKNLIQIAGVLDRKEALMLASSGVDHIGFPFPPDLENCDLSVGQVAGIIPKLMPPVSPVAITYFNSANLILDLCNKLRVERVQIHGNITVDEALKLKNNGNLTCIIKSLIVQSDNIVELIKAVKNYSGLVDAFITDTFDPATGRSGATGKIHNWETSRRIVEISPKPVILAGGLNPGNVAEAIRLVKPAGVDVHTGVESKDGRKDPTLVAEFVNNARTAFNSF